MKELQKVEISILPVYDGAPESQKKLQWSRHKFMATQIFLLKNEFSGEQKSKNQILYFFSNLYDRTRVSKYAY